MKKTLLAIGIAFAIGASATALAASNNNTATVVQEGNDNISFVEQSIDGVGGNQTATINQVGPSTNTEADIFQSGGSNNVATIDQFAESNSQTIITQAGARNTASFIIGGGAGGILGTDGGGSGNANSVDQIGNDHIAMVEQTNRLSAAPTPPEGVRIIQDGGVNVVGVAALGQFYGLPNWGYSGNWGYAPSDKGVGP